MEELTEESTEELTEELTEESTEESTEDLAKENIDTYNIYDHIDLLEIKKLLINYPQLCIIFELLCIHINNLIN